MGRYLTPLPGVMAAAIEFVLGRAAALDDDAERVLAPLAGRWLKFELDGLGIDLWFGAEGGRPRVLAEPEDEDTTPDTTPDTTIGGTPGALLGMALPSLANTGGVRIEGDAKLAQDFQQAMKSLDPDIEKALGEYFGPVIGPQVHRILVEAVEFARQSSETGREQVSRWLAEESELVPRPGEWREFRDGVDRLREAVDRLEAKVERKQRA